MDAENTDFSYNFEIDSDLFQTESISDFENNYIFEFQTRILKPKKPKEIPPKNIKYEYAEKMANDILAEENMRVYAIVNGSFILGDFLEAFITKSNLKVKELTISTLSYSQDNVDSLFNLLNWGYVDKLNLIVSVYFYSHERYNLIPYTYKKLDLDDRFQLAVANTHCKTAIFETDTQKFIISGSGNMRSSGNIEQMAIEENGELYDFNYEYQMNIIDLYKTIQKPIRSRKLWESVKK